MLLLHDAAMKPHVFRWNKPVSPTSIADWLTERQWTVPADLRHFWSETGGGEAFETEKFFTPILGGHNDEGVEQATAWAARQGAPPGLVIFHQGLGISGVRISDRAYLWLQDNKVSGEYSSLDEWYLAVLRSEYAERYGLGPA
jgi:hypothetical protein